MPEARLGVCDNSLVASTLQIAHTFFRYMLHNAWQRRWTCHFSGNVRAVQSLQRSVLIQVDFAIFFRQYITSYTMCICCSHMYMCIYTYIIHINGAFQFVHTYLVMFHLIWFHCLHVDYDKRFVFLRIVTRIPFNGCYCRQLPSRAYR
jgi:hypothetical protein